MRSPSPPRRSTILVLLGVAGAAAVALPLVATAGPGAKAPDLRADPVQKIEGPQVYSDTGVYGAGRLLVRFEGYVTNIGPGPLEVSGNPQVGSVRQRDRRRAGDAEQDQDGGATGWGRGAHG